MHSDDKDSVIKPMMTNREQSAVGRADFNIQHIYCKETSTYHIATYRILVDIIILVRLFTFTLDTNKCIMYFH